MIFTTGQPTSMAVTNMHKIDGHGLEFQFGSSAFLVIEFLANAVEN